MRHRLGHSSSSVAPAREEAEPVQVARGLAETPSWHGSHRIRWRRSRFASRRSALAGALAARSGGWSRRSAHIHRSHTSGSPTRRWNPPCGAGTRGTSSPMASLPSQWHRCPALATPSPSGAPPFLASTSSEEVQKMLNLATASSVQLCYASSCTHSSLHVPFCFYIPSNSRHYRLQFQGADPIDDDCNLFDEMATRAEVWGDGDVGHFPGDENWPGMPAASLPLLMCQSELCVLKNGYNEEEIKMVETSKIWVTETISDRSANWSEYYPRKPALLSIKLLFLSWIGRCKCLLTICSSIYRMTRMWK
jgi:hypothetical protein